jgi:lysophospholipase L1-like esterase
MAGEPGYALSDLLGSADRSDLDVHDEPYAGTGLTRPDGFDWSLKAASQAATEHPDVAVVFLGENDGFPLDGVSPYSAGWQRLYSARVQAVIDAYQAGGVKLVIWAAPPIDAQTNSAEGSNVNAIFRNIEAAVRDAVGTVSGTAMVDQYDLFSVGGRYSTAVPDPTTGATVANARLADGSHLTRAGGMIVARLLLRYLDREAAQRNQQAEAAQRDDPAKPAPDARRSTRPERNAGPSPAPGPSRADGAPAVGSGREDAGPAPRAGSSSDHPARPLGLVLIVVALAVVYGRGVVTRRLLRGRLAAHPLARRIRGARPSRRAHTRPYVGARSRGTHSPGPDTVTATGRVGTVPPTRPVSSPAATGVPREDCAGTPGADPAAGRAGGEPAA